MAIEIAATELLLEMIYLYCYLGFFTNSQTAVKSLLGENE